MATLREEYEKLYEAKRLIESKTFQEFIVSPLREKQKKLHLNFFSDSLKDSWRKGGKYEGIEEFFDILKDIDTDYRNKKDELEPRGE